MDHLIGDCKGAGCGNPAFPGGIMAHKWTCHGPPGDLRPRPVRSIYGPPGHGAPGGPGGASPMPTYKVVTKFRTARGVNFRHTLNDGECTADAMREAREQLAELYGEDAMV